MYEQYILSIQKVLASGDLSHFKSDPDYTYVLEHVTKEQGIQYLQYIQTQTQISFLDIITFCRLNDRIGSPTTYPILQVDISPTSLRYIWHAHVILSYFKSLGKSKIDIVEVGGGYGGLCLALYYFQEKYGLTIQSYTIIDLTDIIKLQELYLNNFPMQPSVQFVDASTFGKEIPKTNLFLVSNYCFSEIPLEYQYQYIQHLFPKIEHGFLAWNMIPLYDFGFPVRVEEETPNTGPLNKFVYF